MAAAVYIFFFTKPHKVIHLMIQLRLSVMDFLHLSRKKETQNTVKKYTHGPSFLQSMLRPSAWTSMDYLESVESNAPIMPLSRTSAYGVEWRDCKMSLGSLVVWEDAKSISHVELH